LAVATTKTAVETVALAVARQLYEASYIYAKSELLAGSSDSVISEKLKQMHVSDTPVK
jgi:hypothetical protein